MFKDLKEVCIHQIFEAQVAQSPDAVAVVFEGKQLTYRELNCQANQLAHYLMTLGVKPEVLVGICVERSLEMVVGLLGILKAGGAYVPLDPAYPLERLAFMLEDAKVPLLLTQTRLVKSLPQHQARVVCLDTDWEVIAQESKENPSSCVTQGNLAYVIYTSGSTGRPKGVLVVHRGLCNLVRAQIQIFNVQPDSRVLQFASLSFDASVWEVVMALMVGARLYLGTRDSLLPGAALMQMLRDQAITTVTLPPSVLTTLPAEDLPALQTIIVAGEACTPDLVERWAPGRQFFNAYGPTESTVCATVVQCTNSSQKPSIGLPIANTQVYLLNLRLEPVPVGESGEIYIGGVGLARGYLNRPDLTAERFILNPFSDNPGERLYKTGDLARYLPDGNIEFLGRIDHQVKIRGFRIELGEIEAALWQHPDVREAVVTVREDVPGDKRLVAYIVSKLIPDRVPMQSVCLAEFNGNHAIEVTSQDISVGGISLMGVPDTLKRGSRVRLRLDLPVASLDALWLEGKVAWRNEKQAGIEFDVNPTTQTLLSQAVDLLLEKQGFWKILQRSVTKNLRNFLKQNLPDYMVPSSFVLLKALPLTPNGKVDRKALSAPDTTRPDLEAEFVAPCTSAEEMLAGIWTEVLHLDQIGIHDNFWELGGHSLLAAQIISRVRDSFKVELPLRSLFEMPTVAELSRSLEKADQKNSGLLFSPIQPISRQQNLPLSFAQQQLWVLAQLEPDIPVYNEVATVRMTGPIDANALKKAFDEIIKRHEIWRTTFSSVDGLPVQVIHEEQAIALPLVNLQALPELEREAQALLLATEAARQPFDLATGPLLRATLIQLSETDYRLYLTLHHIVIDGISLYNVFLPELATLYEAFSTGKSTPLTALPIQYADFAHWQRQWVQAEGKSSLESQLAYWNKQLADLPILQLPTDRPRPAVQTFRGAKQYQSLPKTLTAALKDLSRQAGVTLFTTLLAAFKTLLHRYARQDDIVIGTVTAGRDRPEIENALGFFLNTLVLRTDLSANPSFRELLTRVHEVALAAYSHQNVPFEQLVEAIQPDRNLSQNPLFQVMFILEPPMPTVDSGWTISQMDVDTATAKLDLTLSLEETPEGIIGCWEYNTDLFDAATITRARGHFQTLLEAIVANPDRQLAQLPLLTTAERQQLLEEWNNTQADYPKDLCIHQLFEAQVAQTPDAVAVVFEGEQLTYRGLNCQANQLAHHLKALGVEPEVLVGICVERSLEMVVGLLGILKAGGTYIPLDPAYPKERLAFMLGDAQVSVLLTQSKLVEALPEYVARMVCLDTDWKDIAQQSDEPLASNVQADNLAYVIYTSGSTGKPKGVQISHYSVVNFLYSMRQEIGLTEQDKLLSVTTLSFDIAVLELFLPLTVGASVILVSREVASDGNQLLNRLVNSDTTIMQATPTTWHLLLEAGWRGSNQLKILCGGEALPRELAERLKQRCHSLWNVYGPTEATIWSATYKVESKDSLVPIGRPIANTNFYVLDAQMQPVPIGVPGELYIGGDGLARGYLNRPDLTADRFIPNPFFKSSELEKKSSIQNYYSSSLYKTGDLVRYLPDGNIEYIGRIDHQVKVRGFRIELGEIEAALSQHPAVREVVVVAREDVPGEKSLVAYITSSVAPERVPMQSGCLAEYDGNRTIELKTEDISCSGVCVVGVPATWKQGQLVRLRLVMSAGDEQWLKGHVIWRQENRAGIQFNLTSTEQAVLNQTVESLLERQGLMKTLQRTIVGNLRSFLQQKLPYYMMPDRIVMMNALPLTPNGKINRRALPAPGQTRPEVQAIFVAPRTPVEEQLANIWTNVLGIEQVGIQDNFFELGGNSIRAAQLIAYTRETFQVELPVRCVFEHPTVEKLAQAIEKLHHGGISAITNVIDLKAEAVLDADIYPTGTFVGNVSEPQQIFLTGATGFLGAFLLHDLLDRTQAKIYCLVRASNAGEGLNKLQENLEKYSLFNPNQSYRIIPVLGNLTQPLLGLSVEQFNKLAEQIDTIYHNGALVDFVQPYSLLKSANVLGTQEVLRFACRGKVKPVHYVSTYSVFGTVGYFTELKIIREEDNIDLGLGYLYLGYSESKWVAEKLVWIAKSRGLPVSVYRPALMLGDSHTGIINPKDYAARLMKGCIQIGSFPDLVDEKKHFVPVDYVSQTIVHLSIQKESLGKAFHLVNPQSIYFVQFFELIREYGYPLKKLPYSQWKEELIQQTRSSQDNALYPLLPLHTEKVFEENTLPELYQNNPDFDCKNTLTGLAGTSIVCPPVDQKLISTYISYCVRNGFLEPALVPHIVSG